MKDNKIVVLLRCSWLYRSLFSESIKTICV